jgi:hypothetical protein
MNEQITEILSRLECPEHPRFSIVGGHIFFDGLPISETIKSYLSFPHKGHRERRIEDFCAIARCWFVDNAEGIGKRPALDYYQAAQNWRALWKAVKGEGKSNG